MVDEAEAVAVYLHHLRHADLPDAEPVLVLVVNMGAEVTSAVLLSVARAAVRVRASSVRAVGAWDLDHRTAMKLVALEQAKGVVGLAQHPRSYNKIHREARKVKEMLSTTPSTTVQLEEDVEATVGAALRRAGRLPQGNRSGGTRRHAR
jgi:molecular chaperone DnaK (HSP70)